MEIITRFLIGGLVVSSFALIGSLFKPTSFAGLFGAAPSVALASLAFAVADNSAAYATLESRSMLIGAVAMGMAGASWLAFKRWP